MMQTLFHNKVVLSTQGVLMATYTKVSSSVPSAQRVAVLSDVEEGDRINIEDDVLGRPARTVVFQMTDSSDTVEYKVNNLRRIRPPLSTTVHRTAADAMWGEAGESNIEWWSARGDVFTGTGAIYLETVEGLQVSSIEIVSLDLSTGTTITITVSQEQR